MTVVQVVIDKASKITTHVDSQMDLGEQVIYGRAPPQIDWIA